MLSDHLKPLICFAQFRSKLAKREFHVRPRTGDMKGDRAAIRRAIPADSADFDERPIGEDQRTAHRAAREHAGHGATVGAHLHAIVINPSGITARTHGIRAP